MAPHIITLPPPKLSTSRTQFLANLAFRRLQTRVQPYLICSMNLDSSLNQTRLQFCSPLLCCTIGHLQVDVDVSVLCQSKDIWWVRKPFSRRRFLTVRADIRRRPGTVDAVSLAVTIWFLRRSTRMQRYWAADVSVLCYRLMVGTTDIDFEVTSSECYGL